MEKPDDDPNIYFRYHYMHLNATYPNFVCFSYPITFFLQPMPERNLESKVQGNFNWDEMSLNPNQIHPLLTIKNHHELPTPGDPSSDRRLTIGWAYWCRRVWDTIHHLY